MGADSSGRGGVVQQISVLDMHTAGEPVRIVTGGYPVLAGATILEKRREARERHDHLRRALMLEPRGHAGMYGVIPVAPTHPEAAAAALFTHNEGYSTMCGHATIALGRWLVESGQVAGPRFLLELPCGLVEVEVERDGGRVTSTAFTSVPSFLGAADVRIDLPGHGELVADLVYGGAWYLLLPASRMGADLFGTPLSELVELGTRLTEAGRRQLSFDSGQDPDLGFLYGTILTDDAAPPADSWNLCVFAAGQVDRSPTGSGVSARMARDHARGLIGTGVDRRFFGISGQPFTARVAGPAGGPAGAVHVRVAGEAHISGAAEFRLEADDPFRHGFALRARLAEGRR